MSQETHENQPTPPEVVAWINDVFRRRLRDDPELAGEEEPEGELF